MRSMLSILILALSAVLSSCMIRRWHNESVCADSGEAEACYRVGFYAASKERYATAKENLSGSCSKGYALACYKLSEVYFKLSEEEKYLSYAVKSQDLFREQCSNGSDEACRYIANYSYQAFECAWADFHCIETRRKLKKASSAAERQRVFQAAAAAINQAGREADMNQRQRSEQEYQMEMQRRQHAHEEKLEFMRRRQGVTKCSTRGNLGSADTICVSE